MLTMIDFVVCKLYLNKTAFKNVKAMENKKKTTTKN